MNRGIQSADATELKVTTQDTYKDFQEKIKKFDAYKDLAESQKAIEQSTKPSNLFGWILAFIIAVLAFMYMYKKTNWLHKINWKYLVLIVIVLVIYQTCFRYEYKTSGNSHTYMKIDKLTGNVTTHRSTRKR